MLRGVSMMNSIGGGVSAPALTSPSMMLFRQNQFKIVNLFGKTLCRLNKRFMENASNTLKAHVEASKEQHIQRCYSLMQQVSALNQNATGKGLTS